MILYSSIDLLPVLSGDMLLSVNEPPPSHQSVAMMSQSDMSQASYNMSQSSDMSSVVTPTSNARNMISQLMAAQRYSRFGEERLLYQNTVLRSHF